MRKLLCVCVILAALLGLSVAVSAAGDAKVTVDAAGDTAPGDRITFIVSVSDSDEVIDCQIGLKYDESVFELKGTQWLVSVDSETVDEVTGALVAVWSAPTDIDGNLFLFTLQVKEDATPGAKTSVSCSVSVTDVDDEPLVYRNVTAASVTIGCEHTTYVQKAEDRYIKTPGTCQAPAEYYVSCSACGQKGTDTFFSQEMGEHVFDAKTESEEYLSDPGDCKTGASYFYSCSVCGEAGEETFTSKTLGEHRFDAKVETEEYLSDPGDCQTKRQYYYSCSGCGEKGQETFVSEKKFGVHEYDDACDTECNVCGKYQEPAHIPAEEWSADEEGHYHLCTVCEEKVDLQEHVPGPEATAEEHQVCTVCQYVLAVSDEHVHEYSSEWVYDEKSHWHECSCGLSKSDLAVHSWSLVETDRTDVLIARCDVCGATKEEPVTDIPDETDPTQTAPTQPTTQSTQTSREKGGANVPAIVLGILLALSLTGNGVLVYLQFFKTKKR